MGPKRTRQWVVSIPEGEHASEQIDLEFDEDVQPSMHMNGSLVFVNEERSVAAFRESQWNWFQEVTDGDE